MLRVWDLYATWYLKKGDPGQLPWMLMAKTTTVSTVYIEQDISIRNLTGERVFVSRPSLVIIHNIDYKGKSELNWFRPNFSYFLQSIKSKVILYFFHCPRIESTLIHFRVFQHLHLITINWINHISPSTNDNNNPPRILKIF